MTKPIILKAKDFDDMESIAKPFIDNGYKIMSSDARHIIVKKRNFGKIIFHILFLFLILFGDIRGNILYLIASILSINVLWLTYIVCIAYMIYFSYYLFKKSKIILFTTESTDADGNPVEFDDIESVDID